MKKIYILAAAFAAMAMVSCVKDEPKGQETPESNKVTVDFTTEEIETKTIFGDLADGKFPTLWEADDAVAVSVNYGAAVNTAVTPSGDGKTASFSAEVSVPQAGPYTLYAVHPAAAFENSSATVTIPAEQNGRPAMVLTAKSEEYDEVPSQVTFQFAHLTGYAKINCQIADETIASVTVTSDKDLAGTYSYDFANLTAKEAVKTITATPAANGELIIACAPQTDATWTISVTTKEGNTYTKTSKLPKDITSGFVLGLNVKFSLPSALYIGTAATKDELNIEEKTACEWMLANIENSAYVSFADFNKVDLRKCKVVWWHFHIDNGIEGGKFYHEYATGFWSAKDKLVEYYNNGGSFFLTRYATHLPEILGATKDKRLPNNCWGGAEDASYCENPWDFKTYGETLHPIYEGLKGIEEGKVIMTDAGYTCSNSTSQWHFVEDWTGYADFDAWTANHGATAIGIDWADPFNVVAWEYPVNANGGKIVCVGAGSYDWYSPSEYTENYHTNVATMTKNAFDYLSK